MVLDPRYPYLMDIMSTLGIQKESNESFVKTLSSRRRPFLCLSRTG